MEKTISSKEYGRIVKLLKQARIEAGLRQLDVAKKVKRPQSYISRLESGEYRVDVLELKMLAKIYNKSIGWFLR
jgi:transcriptional regulator with XRE-family HTH domain